MSEPRQAPSNGKYITCEEVLTFLGAYVAGELPPEKVAELERHLSVCPSCVNYIESYRKTIDLSRGSFQDGACEPLDEDLPDDLIQAVLAATRKS
jgi:anti-sigma factor RsiW